MNLKKAKALRRYVRIQYPDLPKSGLMAKQTNKTLFHRTEKNGDETKLVPVYAIMAVQSGQRGVYRRMKKVVYGRN